MWTPLAKIKPTLVLGAALAVFGAGVWLRGLAAERAAWEEAHTALLRENLALSLEAEAGRKALARREAEARRLAEETETLREELNVLYASNPAARTWADTALPDDVYGRLR